jgi:hypothetical protein
MGKRIKPSLTSGLIAKKDALTSNLVSKPVTPEGDDPVTVILNFRVAPSFQREFKTWCASQGLSMKDALIEGFELLKRKRGE